MGSSVSVANAWIFELEQRIHETRNQIATLKQLPDDDQIVKTIQILKLHAQELQLQIIDLECEYFM